MTSQAERSWAEEIIVPTSERVTADETVDAGRQSESDADHVSGVATFLDAVLGDAHGFVHGAAGRGGRFVNGSYQFENWESFSYSWPEERDDLVLAITSAPRTTDTYLCPYVLGSASRRSKGTAVERRMIHADIDCGTFGDEAATSVRRLGGFAVASGSPGNAHVYVPLTDPVDVKEHEALCRGLGAYLGGADAKVSDNDVLRPVGTFNQKPVAHGGDPTPVTWSIEPTGQRVDTKTVASLLQVDLAAATCGPSAVSAHTRAETDEALPAEVRTAVSRQTGDRSVDSYGVLAACHDSGFSFEQAVAVLETRGDLRERILVEGHEEDPRRCWDKIAEGSEGRSDNVGPNLPGWFWERPSLARIRDQAHARKMPADGVLNCVLARISAAIPPNIRLDTGILSPLPMHHYAAVVGPSGGFKSQAISASAQFVDIITAVAQPENSRDGMLHCLHQEVVPYEIGLGSGQGLVAAFVENITDPVPDGAPKGTKPKVHPAQVRTNVLLTNDEGYDLVKACARTDNGNVGENLRSMWSGAQVGTHNAGVEHRRHLHNGAYTFALIAGFQEEVLAEFINTGEVTKGTPQRFLCTYSLSPGVQRVADPGPLAVTLPETTVQLCDEAKAIVEAHQDRVLAGDVDVPPMESQRPAMVARTAALLAILDSRHIVDMEDWRRAETMFKTSLNIADRAKKKHRQHKNAVRRAERDLRVADELTAHEAKSSPEGRLRARILEGLAEHSGRVRWNGGDGLRARFNGPDRQVAEVQVRAMQEDGTVKMTKEGRAEYLERLP